MRLILFIATSLLIISCAPKEEADFEFKDGQCSGAPQIGKWVNEEDTLYVSGDCRGYMSYCGVEFTFEPFTMDTLTLVTVTKKDNDHLKGNPVSCMSPGEYSCHFSLYQNDQNRMNVICGAYFEVNYVRN